MEAVILEFYSKRDICCHTGGSIAFDNNGLLYLSTGDNSTPFNQPDQPYVLDGYAPLDERSGYDQYDAQRTSGNTNDLCGKILCILSEKDADKIASWILSLNGEGLVQESLPFSGEVDPTLGKKPTQNGVLILSASYTDKGAAGVKPLTGETTVQLKNSAINLADAEECRQ